MPKVLVVPEYLTKRHKRTCKELTAKVTHLRQTIGPTQELMLLERYCIKLKGSLFRNRNAIIRLKESFERLAATTDMDNVVAICHPAIKLIRDILILTKGTGT